MVDRLTGSSTLVEQANTLANPPFSDQRWSNGVELENDPHGRFEHVGVPPARQAARGQGDAIVQIKAAALAEIELVIPDPDEQSAIAGIVRDIDSELIAIEARLAKARLIKQGMMQDLLTGKIRLV